MIETYEKDILEYWEENFAFPENECQTRIAHLIDNLFETEGEAYWCKRLSYDNIEKEMK